jgi:AAA+ superfamily predicted ATPase
MSSSAAARGVEALASQITEAVCEDGAWAGFAPALRRLDALLGRAVELARLRFGEGAATDPYRGLHITLDQVDRALAVAPGTPLLYREARPDDASEPGETPSLALLSDVLGLEDFDLDVVIIALAPELDLRYERLYSYLQDDVTRRRPTVDLALNLLCRTAAEKIEWRRRFLPEAPLLRHGLIELVADPAQGASPPLLAHYLRLDGQILRRMLGQDGLDAPLASFCELVLPYASAVAADASSATASALAALAASARAAARPLLLHFHGPAGTGRRRTAEALAASLAAPLLAVDLNLALARTEPWGRTFAALFRQARLDGALLYFDGVDALEGEERRRERRELLRMASAEGGMVAILAGQRTPGRDTAGAVAISFDVGRFEGRRAQWQKALAAAGITIERGEIDALAGRFRLTADQIDDAVVAARGRALWRGALAVGPDAAPGSADLFAAARAQSGHELLGLARPIEPKHSWADIVLPSDQLARLHEICVRATLRHIVYDRWGFDKKLSTGRGLSALFSGPSGTGKTMAAEIIAGELGLDLYKIDVSQIVSKYIGETEKNLDRIFQAAETANAILFFDEADALFGKRSEVKDAHDRYANIEVGYLLQKMDEYEGIAILATNLRQNMDDAFIRRLHIVVEFPFPGEDDRRRIWSVIFPPEAPLAPEVDFNRLAREVRLSGGKIRNIAVSAAFQAASANGVIGMSELLEAARREYEKSGQTWQPIDGPC